MFIDDSQNATDRGEPDRTFFIKRKEIRYHLVYIPSSEATITVRIKPKKNITLRVFVRKGSRPTDQQYDLNLTLPNSTLPSCSKVSKGKNMTCLPRDPYEFDLLPNATGYMGRHFIGIKIQEDSLYARGMSPTTRSNNPNGNFSWGTEVESCVKEKPPPPTPPPTDGTFPRQFNPETDVYYTFHVTVGSCVFRDTLREKWSARGCQVSDWVARNSLKKRLLSCISMPMIAAVRIQELLEVFQF